MLEREFQNYAESGRCWNQFGRREQERCGILHGGCLVVMKAIPDTIPTATRIHAQAQNWDLQSKDWPVVRASNGVVGQLPIGVSLPKDRCSSQLIFHYEIARDILTYNSHSNRQHSNPGRRSASQKVWKGRIVWLVEQCKETQMYKRPHSCNRHLSNQHYLDSSKFAGPHCRISTRQDTFVRAKLITIILDHQVQVFSKP